MRFNAFYTEVVLVFLVSFSVLIPNISRVMINTIKKTVVVMLLITEKTFVTLAEVSDESGKLINIVIIPKFSA